MGLVDVLDQALEEVAFHQREDHPFVSSAVGVACYLMEDLALAEVACYQMEDLALVEVDHDLVAFAEVPDEMAKERP